MKTENQIKYLYFPISLLGFALLCLLDHRIKWNWIYTHWLYDYHFGFMKRSLIGAGLAALVSTPVISLSLVKILSWILFFTVVFFFLFFFHSLWKKLTDFEQKKKFFSFFVFCLLAPVSLRNYAYDLGRFDQLGLLLLFAQWFAIPTLVTALFSAILVFIHEGFIFIFLPAILLLIYLRRGFSSAFLVAVFSAIATLFVLKFGRPNADIDTLWSYLLSKADSPLDHNIELFYRSFRDQLQVNWNDTKLQAPYLPAYLFYLLFILPPVFLVSSVKLDLKATWLKRGIVVGYLAIFILTCDWCRHTANAFLVLTFLSLTFLQDPSVRTQVFTWRFFSVRNFGLLTALSLLVPAAGVEIPRIVKLWQILAPHVKV